MNETVKPAVIDDAEFLAAAEDVLRDGETVADLIDRSARAEVERRRERAAFIARGLASEAEAERSGIYYDPDEVHAELKTMLEAKRAERRG